MVSEIKSTASGIVQATDNRNNIKNNRVEETNKPSASAATSSANVNLTQAGNSLQALEKSIEAAPVVDHTKVDSVRKSINEGNYQVDSERTASKLIDFDTALPKSS